MKGDYERLIHNITIAGLSLREFSDLIKTRPTSVANLKQEDRKVPKSMLIISALMREMAISGIDFRKCLEAEEYAYKASPRKKKA